MPQVELRVVSGKQAGASIPLQKGKFLIGREHDCHLRPNSDLVSRHHCAFTVDDYSVQVRDLGSTNGTFVNGERTRGIVLLNPGDRVTVGKLEFEVVIDGQPASATETVLHDLEDTATSLSGEFVVKPVDQPPAETTSAAPASPLLERSTVEIDAQAPTAGAEFTPPMPPSPLPSQPWMVPPQTPPVPYPGGYPPYPAMPYGYGYPPYPGMPPLPQPGYPYSGPVPTAPAGEATASPAPPKELAEDVVPGIRLPDPRTTGAKDPEPPAPKPAESGKGESKTIPSAAQDIINSYLQRRPKS
jgi:predicted component of type VI protein secretion system